MVQFFMPHSVVLCSWSKFISSTGVDQAPPEFGAGDANANCPPRFCHIGTKMSVLWPSKYAEIRFRLGLCPGPRWGSSRRSLDPLVGWRGDTPPYPTPLSTDPPSALAMRPPPRSPARSTPMISRSIHARLQVSTCCVYDLCHRGWPVVLKIPSSASLLLSSSKLSIDPLTTRLSYAV